MNFTSRRRWHSRSKLLITLPQQSMLRGRQYPSALGSNNLEVVFEMKGETPVSVWLKLVPWFCYFCYSGDSKKTHFAHKYCLLLLKRNKTAQQTAFGEGRWVDWSEFCGCSVTLSRKAEENIVAIKICFSYSDLSSVSLILIR